MAVDLLQNNLTAVAGTVNDRNAFTNALDTIKFAGNAQGIAKYDMRSGGRSQTTIDNSGYVEDAVYELNLNQPLNAGGFRGYESTWAIKEYTKRIALGVNDVADLTSEEFNCTAMVNRAFNGYVTFATSELAKLCKAMYGTGGNIYARYDDVPASHWFDTTHELGGTTFSNYLTDKIDAFDATHYGYLLASVAAWEALPDALGTPLGMGNDLAANGLIIVAPNLKTIFQQYENAQSISATGDNMFYKNLPHIVLGGLADDTVIITRKPTDIVPGFYWSEVYSETLIPPRGSNGNIGYNWYHSVRMAMTGSVWMSSLLVL
ncbi:MAG: hypothetical protein GY832_31020 [Chloroflexi bacterium]|nr:hypothetical protein [Chloroflexota bacterium]